MKRILILAAGLLFLLPFCLAQQQSLPSHQLPSGRVIFPMKYGPMLTPNMPKEKVYFFSYRTQIAIKNHKELEDEAHEVWQEYRTMFEAIPGITVVVFEANDESTGGMVQHNDSYHMPIQHMPEGNWKWVE